MTRPDLVAHRGYPLRYPENTLVGIEAALDAGTGYLEVDVQLSADGVPVLFHDRGLRRVCGVPGAVHEMTLRELAELRAYEPDVFGERFRDVRLATLEELVGTLADRSEVTVFVEIKSVSVELFGAGAALERVLRFLEPIRERAVLISFVPAVVAEAGRREWPRRGLIVQTWPDASREATRRLEADYLFCNVAKLPRQGDLRLRGTRLAVYDVVEPALAADLAGRGIDLVETFAIGEMLEHFRND